jgi:hypothetical protein
MFAVPLVSFTLSLAFFYRSMTLITLFGFISAVSGVVPLEIAADAQSLIRDFAVAYPQMQLTMRGLNDQFLTEKIRSSTMPEIAAALAEISEPNAFADRFLEESSRIDIGGLRFSEFYATVARLESMCSGISDLLEELVLDSRIFSHDPTLVSLSETVIPLFDLWLQYKQRASVLFNQALKLNTSQMLSFKPSFTITRSTTTTAAPAVTLSPEEMAWLLADDRPSRTDQKKSSKSSKTKKGQKKESPKTTTSTTLSPTSTASASTPLIEDVEIQALPDDSQWDFVHRQTKDERIQSKKRTTSTKTTKVPATTTLSKGNGKKASIKEILLGAKRIPADPTTTTTTTQVVTERVCIDSVCQEQETTEEQPVQENNTVQTARKKLSADAPEFYPEEWRPIVEPLSRDLCNIAMGAGAAINHLAVVCDLIHMHSPEWGLKFAAFTTRQKIDLIGWLLQDLTMSSQELAGRSAALPSYLFREKKFADRFQETDVGSGQEMEPRSSGPNGLAEPTSTTTSPLKEEGL